jgi:hypothetical protein
VERRQISLRVLVALGVASIVAARPARAAEPSCAGGDSACGAAAFARGTENFDRGRYEEAAGFFSAAASANAHPVVVFNLALSEARLGKFTSAAARMRALLADQRLDAKLRARLERELAAAEAGIAHVSFELPAAAGTRFFLDGEPIQVSPDDVPVDPGKHQLRVESGDEVLIDQQVDLMPGERLRVRVSSRSRAIDVVVVPSTEKRAPERPRPAPRPVPAPAADRGVSPLWFYGVAAGTAALGALTVWSGLDVHSAYDDYRADLPELNQAQADRRVDEGHERELRTNLLLGATLLGAAGTAVLGLVFVDWSDSRGAGAPSTGVSLTPFGVAASARFSAL